MCLAASLNNKTEEAMKAALEYAKNARDTAERLLSLSPDNLAEIDAAIEKMGKIGTAPYF